MSSQNFVFIKINNPQLETLGAPVEKPLYVEACAAQSGVNSTELKDFEIPLPPLDDQKRIAAILDKADSIRRKRQQAIKLADDFLRSVFLDMFGDPVTNPKGWEVKPLIELCSGTFQNGAYFEKSFYGEAGIEMVHMGDAFYDVIKRGGLKRVRCSTKEMNKYLLAEDDLLISRRSLTYEGAAKPSLIKPSEEPLIFESSLIRITPNKDWVHPKYLFKYLANDAVKNTHIRKYVTGATIKGISQKNLERVKVFVPPKSLQEKFVSIMQKVERQSFKSDISNDNLSNIFCSLSQKSFSGEL